LPSALGGTVASTFSDPTGLLRDCGPDGVLCGRDPRMYDAKPGQPGDTFEAEQRAFQGREGAWQQARRGAAAQVRQAMAKEGISEADYARALADAHKTKWDVIKEVAWEVLKEISGWNDIVDCFTGGDIWACGGLVAGLVPFGKIGKILEAGYNAVKAVSRLSSIVDKARGVLRRVQGMADDAERVATEEFQKLGSCVTGKHSFVRGTLVLMADGSAKPIAEVEIGDKVKATDPATGETTDRDVVATIVHADEDDMTRLTVESEDGSTGTVDATSWHPVWVNAQGRFVNIGDLKPGQRLTSADGSVPRVTDVDRYRHYAPVYDLTVDGVHTYYVVAGTTPVLVHNNSCPRVFAVDSAGSASELPVHEIDSGAFPGVAANFANAVASGKSPIVTRLTGRSNIRANRNAAQSGAPRPGTLGNGLSWEEFPFASTREGGAGATLSLIPLTENSAHGLTSLWPFLRDNGVKGGDQYYVRGR
jgi:hypothetical protein